MWRAWRIVKSRLAKPAFTGEGAAAFGGRWNSPGVPLVYTAGSPSLAMLEMLVHLQRPELLESYVLIDVQFDESLVIDVELRRLPRSWRMSPPARSVMRVGDSWAASESSAVLRVPSVLVPHEWNYLLNPKHRDFGRIVIGMERPIRFDPRLLTR